MPQVSDTYFRPEQVHEVLQSIKQHHLTLQVSLDTPDTEDLSLLLELDRQAGFLVLDAPRNMRADRFISGQTIVVTVWKRGIQLRFRVPIKAQGTFEDNPALITGWPDTIEYVQRREAFRIRLRNTRSHADLYLRNGIHVAGRILDISVSGFSTLVEQEAELNIGDRFDCEIEIERNKSEFFAVAEVKNLAPVGLSDQMRVGSRFVELDQTQRIRLEKIIREFEREQLRARRKNQNE